MRAIQEHNLEAQTVADTVGAGSGIFLPEPWITDHTPAPEEFRLPGAHEPEATIRQPASEAAVFGESSRLEISLLCTAEPKAAAERQPLNYLLLDGLTVSVMLLFFGILYRHRTSMAQLFRSFFTPGQFDVLIDEQSVSFRTFIRQIHLTAAVGLLTLAFKWAIRWSEAQWGLPLPAEWTPFLLPLLTGMMAAVWCYRRIVSALVVVLTRRPEPIEKITAFNRLYLAMSAFLLIPVTLLCALADPMEFPGLVRLQLIAVILLVLYYLMKSFSFFVSRKISILHWILYLCAVEIWPVSFFALFALRGFEW